VKPEPKSSLFRKILHTFATLAFGQGSSIAAGIATARLYGPSGKGVLALAAILLGFAYTAADGVRQAVSYQIGSEKREPRAVWHTALRVVGVTGLIGTAILLVLWRFSPSETSIAYLYVALAFPFALFVQAAGMLYILRDRVEKINVQNALTIGGGYSLLTLAIVIVFRAPVWVVLSTWVVTYVAAAFWAETGVPEMLGHEPVGDRTGLLREQLFFASKVALSSTITLLALRVDVFIITALLSTSVLGIYTMALAAAEITWNVSKAVLWSASGRIATLDFGDSAALCAQLVRCLVAFQFATGIVLFAFGPWLIDHVYGARFHEAGGVLRVLLPGVVFYSADGVLSNFIAVRAARPGLLLVLECVTLVLTAAITFVSISRLGVYAGAWAHTISYIVSYVVKMTIFVRLTGTPVAAMVLPRYSDLPGFLRLRSVAAEA
jgi:O-antigen/teichoic acid export membrane protein